MNYETTKFNSQRISPKQKLRLPLSLIKRSMDRHGPPMIKDGMIYQIKPGKVLKAIDEKTFDLIKINESKPFIRSGFCFMDSTFLVECDEGNIQVIDCKNLEICDSFDLDIYSDSLSLGNREYQLLSCQERGCFSADIKLVRKRAKLKVLDWCFTPEDTLKGFAVSDNGKIVIVTDYKGSISGLDIESGKVIWERNVDSIGVLSEKEIEQKNMHGEGSIDDIPHLFQDVIILGYLFNYIIGLDLFSGQLKWKRKFEDSHVGALTVNDQGKIYFLDAWLKRKSVSLYVIDSLTGKDIAKLNVNRDDQSFADRFASAVYSDVTDSHFWGLTPNGLLYAIDLCTGNIEWHYDLGNGLSDVPMFICNNRLYVQTMSEQFIFEGRGGYLTD